jgi:hypothetical protein
MTDIFSCGTRVGPSVAVRETTPDTTEIFPLTIVVITDRDHPDNIRIVHRRDGRARLCSALTLTLTAQGDNYAVAKTCKLGDDWLVEGIAAGPARFVAMTSQEFERRHGCQPSTPP